MATVPGGVPASLGKVTITTATTPESILKNFAVIDTEGERVSLAWKGKASSILIQALGTNTGLLYVGKVDMSVSGSTGILAELSAGQSISIGSNDSMNLLTLGDFELDVAVSGESAWVSYIQV